MAATGDLTLKVSPAAYQARITTLEGYVTQLRNQASAYEAKRNEINSIWTASQADEYKNAVDQNIAKVNQAIEAAQANIAQMKNLVQNMDTANAGIMSTVEEAMNIAEKLFN